MFIYITVADALTDRVKLIKMSKKREVYDLQKSNNSFTRSFISSLWAISLPSQLFLRNSTLPNYLIYTKLPIIDPVQF